MSTRQVDLLNIALMLVSLVLAYLMPFELFLLSYAILGPLHYLTEIAWLHQRDYFVQQRRQAWWLVLPVIVISVGYFVAASGGEAPFNRLRVVPVLAAGALGAAVAFSFLKSRVAQLALVVASLGAGAVFSGANNAQLILIMFLPTLIHVWLFTAAFVAFGALRNRSVTGYASLAVFAACTAACFLLDGGLQWSNFMESADTREAYGMSAASFHSSFGEFAGIGSVFAPDPNTPGARALDPNRLFLADWSQDIARFIGFAYTYHYLNWFSKTSVIQWHRVPRSWAVSIVLVWLLSLALYAYDYAMGLNALFVLSYLHVYLEFPLNGRTFAGLGQQLGGLFRGRAAAAS
ncbi:MAG: hypothetical protein DHS20C15_13880 [Planctomycetota bacterium]|nr:MAG: hypothetical protein DHS20C15_13880 [Planctomycetota bacterium]